MLRLYIPSLHLVPAYIALIHRHGTLSLQMPPQFFQILKLDMLTVVGTTQLEIAGGLPVLDEFLVLVDLCSFGWGGLLLLLVGGKGLGVFWALLVIGLS